jgi:hypothetical protein
MRTIAILVFVLVFMFITVYWNFWVISLLKPEQQSLVRKPQNLKIKFILMLFMIGVVMHMPSNWYRFAIFLSYIVYGVRAIVLDEQRIKKFELPAKYLRHRKYYTIFVFISMLAMMVIFLPTEFFDALTSKRYT